MDIYEKFKAAGCQIENWQSDMYVKKDSVSDKIVQEIRKDKEVINIGRFLDDKGEMWYEIPFGFIPYKNDNNK